MIDIKVRIEDKIRAIREAEARTGRVNLYKVGSLLKAIAQNSLKRMPAGVPSAPGKPPHTHPKVLLKRAIRFAVNPDKSGVAIGPVGSVAGDVGNVLEFGGKRGDSAMEKRPFMGPALLNTLSTGVIPRQWSGTIGG